MKWIPHHKIGLNWQKHVQNPSKKSVFALSGDQAGVTAATNHSVFIKKQPELIKKYLKSSPKCQIPLCQGIRLVLHQQPTTLFS